jgi:RecB family endonuclease NucS
MSSKRVGESSMPEPISVVENPTVEKAVLLVKDTLSKRKTLLIVGNCWVDYHGRASSKLEPGERIVIFKKDSSVLVHRPVGYEPINWQPPGCIFQNLAYSSCKKKATRVD